MYTFLAVNIPVFVSKTFLYYRDDTSIETRRNNNDVKLVVINGKTPDIFGPNRSLLN